MYVLAAVSVTILTQLSKLIDGKLGIKVLPKTLAAVLALLLGLMYALMTQFGGMAQVESMAKFGGVVFAGAVAFYEMYKSAVALFDSKPKRK